MKDNKIQAVIFDCFGVLTGDVWKEFVGSLPEDQRSNARDLNRALDKNVISHDEFYQQINQLTGREVPMVEKIITSDMHKNKEVFKYIQSLKGKYKLAVLSNVSTNWIREQFLTPEEISLFDDFVLSHEVGLIKPDPEIFKLAAKRLGVEVEDCLFIDDSPYNAQAAENLGMKAITYQNFSQFRSQADKLLF
ncbi:HAD family phosphatase [Candidatus Saccharibacteria bacterium]|nr:HAD family phosphatase [Candidatus Saccharibacteria bacterium]